ncbi:helix-turn-helix domain-containing protein [Streptomyces mirabilis]|uniref:helix-turn-helix domain-containing protein n=1 Tax=Streptomyces mirabilis TaxID=68239 RepID=UPI00369B1F7F
MSRQISYRWRLRELMAARGMFTVAELMPHLTERGITLSSSQVHRLVSGTPERLSLPVLATLCDILDCTPTDLITTSAQNLPARRAVGEEAPVNPGRPPTHAGPADARGVSDDARGVRAVDDPRLRTLRPSSLQVRRVVGRPDLPNLLRPCDAHPRPLPLLRH